MRWFKNRPVISADEARSILGIQMSVNIAIRELVGAIKESAAKGSVSASIPRSDMTDAACMAVCKAMEMLGYKCSYGNHDIQVNW